MQIIGWKQIVLVVLSPYNLRVLVDFDTLWVYILQLSIQISIVFVFISCPQELKLK